MPVTYAESAYKEVMTWTAETRIKYAPNRKSGKSFHRYGKYMTAKTVGETLDRGSYPLDLLFDFEKGLLKAAGGPKRKQPPTVTKENKASFTRTDRILSGMYAKWQMWKATFATLERTGLDRMELKKEQKERDDGTHETLLIHAQRADAESKAKTLLADVKASNRRATDEDVLSVLRLWGFMDNKNRANVMKEGVKAVNSDTVGLVVQTGTGRVLIARATERYPHVMQLLGVWLRQQQPKELSTDFPFTSININRGYAGKLHRDANNFGPSMIRALGKFSGGELNYWASDKKSGPLEALPKKPDISVDISKNLLMFDGNRGHSVNDFKGERFSLVFFTVRESRKASTEQAKILRDCGISFPTPKAKKYVASMLNDKVGYRVWSAAQSQCSKRPAEGAARGCKRPAKGLTEAKPSAKRARKQSS